MRRHERMRDVIPTGSSWSRRAGSSSRCAAASREIERIAAAARRRRGLRVLREQGLVGRTEREVAFALENEMRRRGAEPGFESIVASAERGAPAACPADGRADRARNTGHARHRRARRRLPLRLHSERATGELPDDLAEAYEVVGARSRRRWTRSGQALRARGRRGGARRSSTRPATASISATGWDMASAWRSRGPAAARTAKARLEAGNVVTVEPGVYLPGRAACGSRTAVITGGRPPCSPAPPKT